jgi:hypothetical protein
VEKSSRFILATDPNNFGDFCNFQKVNNNNNTIRKSTNLVALDASGRFVASLGGNFPDGAAFNKNLQSCKVEILMQFARNSRKLLSFVF